MLPGGQALTANCTLVQIVLMWAWSRNSECGRATEAPAMLALPEGIVSTAFRAGLSARFVPPLRERASLGLKGNAEQPPTWKGLCSAAVLPNGEVAEPVSASGSQEVGLRVKLGRSILSAIERTSIGIPCRICGIGSLTARM